MLNCDLFSLAEVNIVEGEVIIENDPLYNLLNKPNPFQTRRQFLWDYMFWNMLGCANMYSTSKVAAMPSTRLYWLNNAGLEYPTKLKEKLDKIYRSNQSVNELERELVKYNYADGTQTTFKLGELKIFADISNGLGNWYGSPSRLDALYKIVSNSEAALDAKNINLRFSGKFMVSGKTAEDNIYETQLTPVEKESIESKALKNNPVTALKSPIDIQRYVENIANLKLDDSYQADLMAVGSMYGIPKELLDVISKGSTYENQEKALIRHISYSIQPKADDLANGLETYFGYDNANKDLTLTFDHLPCMQVAEAERSSVRKTDIEALQILVQLGADANEVAPDFGLDYKFKAYEKPDTETPADTGQD